MEVKTVKVQHPDNPEDWMWVNEDDASLYQALGQELIAEVDPIARESELREMSWKDIRAIAVGLALTKDDDQSWSDLIPAILQAEGLID